MIASRTPADRAALGLVAAVLLLASGCAPTRDSARRMLKDLPPDHRYGVYYLRNDSMLPTIHANTDQLVVDESAYDSAGPARGDVIVFVSPLDPKEQTIKRVIAIPGDKLAIRGGSVTVNGQVLHSLHPAYDFSVASYQMASLGAPLDGSIANVPPRSRWRASDRLPTGCFFVLGDNVDASADSHLWGCTELRGTFSAGPHRGERAGLIGKVVKIVAGLRPTT